MSSGKNFLTKGSKIYRPWAAKSNIEGYIKCIWCSSEFKAKYTTGKNGHENTAQHIQNAEKREKEKDFDSNLEKQRSVFTKATENERIQKLFEFRLLNFCLSIRKTFFLA